MALTVTYNGNSNTGGTVPIDNNAYAFITNNNITFLAVDNSINIIGDSFLTSGFIADQYIQVIGSVLNNTFGYIQSATATKIILAGAAIVNESDINQITIATIVTVLGNTGSLTRAGYKFVGWNYLDTEYVSGAIFRIDDSNVTLYAQWAIYIRNDIAFNNIRNAIQIDGTPTLTTPDFGGVGFTVGQTVNISGSSKNNVSGVIANLTSADPEFNPANKTLMILSGVTIVYEEFGANIIVVGN